MSQKAIGKPYILWNLINQSMTIWKMKSQKKESVKSQIHYVKILKSVEANP